MPGVLRRGVFLSYRRDDAGPYARSLQLQLSQRIPDAPIFMDLDSIEPGLDFAEVIEDAVSSSAVLVALIGRQWVTLTDEESVRRLDNPDDYVRFEVKTALERGVRVIPVLIDGARALRRQELPAELHKLARLNAAKLSYDRYQDDADRLLDLIQRVLAAVGQEPVADPERELRRPVSPADQEGTARSSPSRERTTEIREWAKQHGIAVSERGRIPASIVEQYNAALAASRPASQANQKGTSRVGPGRERSAEIREWAKRRGYTVNERGRIPASIIADYDAGH